MPRYNHAYTIAFSLVSNDPNGEDVTPEMFSRALRQRADELDASRDPANPADVGGEWLEACGAPYDTYEEEA